jgi:HK97 family phage prohead protease
MQTKEFDAHIKHDSGDGGEWTFEGYAATFDREPDSYGDVIAPGAFAETLKEHEEAGRKIPLLFGHRMDDPDFALGYVDAEEDERGLKVTGHVFADMPKAATVHSMLQRGQIDQMSFAFDVLEDGMTELEDGIKAHELRKLTLYECSVVTVPANQHAMIEEVKAMKTKVGRRNSKADEDELQGVADALQGIIDSATKALDGIDAIIGKKPDDGDEGDEEGQSEDDSQAQSEPPEGDDGKAFVSAYKEAILETI